MNRLVKQGCKPIRRLCVGTMLVLYCSSAFSQELGFADDFSSDSLSWLTEGNGSSSASGQQGAILLQADSMTGSDSQRRLKLPLATDFASFTGTVSAATSLGANFNDQARMRLAARIINDVAPGGDSNHPQGNYGGNVNFALDYFVTGDGVTGAIACFGRESDNGFEGYNIFGDSGSCHVFENFSNPSGSDVTLAYELARETNTLKLSVNDQNLNVSFPGEIFEAFDAFTSIEVETLNTGTATAEIKKNFDLKPSSRFQHRYTNC